MIQDITLRKTKEKEIERLSLVANNTDNSVIITNAAGLTEYVNSGFTKITGYESHEIIGKKPGLLLQGPLTDKETIEKLSKAIKNGIPIYEEILNYKKNGDSYWVSLAINPVKDEHGKITKYISIQADITQTKIIALDFHQKMDALGKSNAILELDKNGNLLEINENYQKILNYSTEELIGKPYSKLTGREYVFTKVLNSIEENGINSGVFTRYDKNGEPHLMRLINYPVLNIKGELEKIIEFGVDVTNEKKLELEAQRKQAELDSYLEGINNTIATAEFSTEGKFLEANDIFLKVLGYKKEELDKVSFNKLLGEEPSIILMWENLKTGKYFSGEFKMKDKNGKELWLSGTFHPITILNDKPEKIIMLAQFTTQEKEKMNDLNSLVHALKNTLPVIEFNEQFICKTANEKALKIFGISRIELRNKTILDLISPFYHSTWKKKMSHITEHEFSNMVIPITIKNQSVNYEISLSVTRNLEGVITRIIVLFIKESYESVPQLAA
jgi:PAS domain S-box-containing protein